MTLYQQLPLQVEALRWKGDNLEEIQAFVGTRDVDVDVHVPAFNPIGTYITDDTRLASAELWVQSMQLIIPVMTGEWIVQDSVGFHAVKDVDFLKSFEKHVEVAEDPMNSDFPVIGPECFTNKDASVISYKGANYFRACDAFVRDLPGGGQSHCVKRVGHIPENVHEDYDGNVNSTDAAQPEQVDP